MPYLNYVGCSGKYFNRILINLRLYIFPNGQLAYLLFRYPNADGLFLFGNGKILRFSDAYPTAIYLRGVF